MMRLVNAASILCLGACAGVTTVEDVQAPPPAAVAPTAPAEDPRLAELRAQVERLSAQLAEAQRRNHALSEEHRRTEAALRENQKRLDDLQQKLDALLEIDRDTRKRWRP